MKAKRRPRRALSHGLVGFILIQAGWAVPRAAGAQIRTATPAPIVFSIPAGPLGYALERFSQTADISLSYDPALVLGKTCAGLEGAFTVDAGFLQVLKGTGLAATAEGPNGYVLRAAAAAGSMATAAATMAPVEVDATAPDDSYSVARESLATGTDTPLQHLPQSVQVVTQAVIRDQQPQTLSDIVHNIGGTNNNPQTYGYSTDAYDVRGYGSRLLLDGLAPQYTFRIPTFGIESVEVLKSSDSAALGDMAHGGIINVILKHPQREPVQEASFQTGSLGHASAALDLGGALSPGSNLEYRLVMSYDKADENFAGYKDLRTIYLAPSIAWDDGTTRLELGIQYSHGRLPSRPFTVLMDGRPAEISNPLGNRDDHSNFDQVRPYLSYDRKLNADWSFHSASSFSRQSATEYSYLTGPANSDGYTYFQGYRGDYYQRDVAIDSHIQGSVSSGAIKHEITTGIAYYALHSSTNYLLGPPTVANILDPQLPFPSSASTTDPLQYSDASPRDLRTYASDFMTVGQRWHLLTGIALSNAAFKGLRSQRVWTPKLGLTYDVSDIVSVYGSYFRGVSIQPALLQNGQLVPPLRSKTVETGAKFSWPDKPLDLSIALFRTSQDNLAEPQPDSFFYKIVGGGQSRGLELNLQGQLTAGWQAIANYTYTNFEPAAGQVNATPRHMASLWSTYSFRSPVLSGWGIGFGVYTQSANTGDGEGVGNFLMPGQTRTDLSVFYRRQRFSATLGIQNVFDRTLYAGHATASSIYLNPGRTLLLTTSYRF